MMTRIGLLSAVVVSLAVVVGCGEKKDDEEHHAPTSIALTPASPSVVTGTSIQFTATGSYEDGDTQDLTDVSDWTSSNPGVATIGATTGLATTNSAGTTTISANHDDVIGTTVLTVTTSS